MPPSVPKRSAPFSAAAAAGQCRRKGGPRAAVAQPGPAAAATRRGRALRRSGTPSEMPPPPKRQKVQAVHAADVPSAPQASALAQIAEIVAALPPLEQRIDYMSRRESIDLDDLERQRASLCTRLYRLRGYLQLVIARPSPQPRGLPTGAPIMPLPAAQLRLALAMALHPRLRDTCAAEIPSVDADLAMLVSQNIHSFDHFRERHLDLRYGKRATEMRRVLRPAPRFEVAVVGYAVEEHPLSTFNGVYREMGERAGWPTFQNEHGVHCFQEDGQGHPGTSSTRAKDQWRFGTDKTLRSCTTWIDAGPGGACRPLPVGRRTWHSKKSGEHTLVITALRTEASAGAARDQINAAREARLTTTQTAICGQLSGTRGADVDGFSKVALNGCFLNVAPHVHVKLGGVPWFRSEHGWYMFYYPLKRRWFISEEHTPEQDRCVAFIDARAGGALPDGVEQWMEWVGTERAWKPRPVTVKLLPM